MITDTKDSVNYAVGKVLKIIYYNYKNPLMPFSICEIEISETNMQIGETKVVIKILAEPPIKGQIYRFFGELSRDEKGLYIQSAAYIRNIPIESSGIVEFLGSGLFEGIRIKKAQRIVETLGDDCLIQIINNPEVLLNVKGVSSKTIDSIQEAILENLGMQELILKLHDFKISLTLAKKIYKHYGHASVTKIQENPYCLSNTVNGISFQKADEIATTLNIVGDDSRRIKGAIEHALNEIYNVDGSTYGIKGYVLKKTNEILFERDGKYYSSEILQKNIQELVSTNIEEMENFTTDIGQVRQLGNRIYLERYFQYEKNIAATLLNLVQNEALFSPVEISKIVDIYIREKSGFDVQLSQTQEVAVLNALLKRVSILTGGPGTGKSTIIMYILIIYSKIQKAKGNLDFREFLSKVILLAPTGRAAKRIFEVTSIEAQTIHSFLERQDEEIKESRLFIIDEASMIDLSIMNRLVKRLNTSDQLILVGDIDQLPPIKAGNVFKDIIDSNIISTQKLNEVYRQKENSGLLDLATFIRLGEMTNEKMIDCEDVKWLSVQRDDIVLKIQSEIIKMINGGIGLEKIQIIAPIHRSEQGISFINKFIQQSLVNKMIPIKNELIATSYSNNHYDFFIGDRVIQLKNNINKNVVNGDIGVVIGIKTAIEENEDVEEEPEQLIVRFDSFDVFYTKEEIGELALAYCFSVHKAQGSEFRHVILPLSNTYSYIINRNLLYTAITRAKQSLIIIGELETFLKGLQREPNKRYTFLKEMLLENSISFVGS